MFKKNDDVIQTLFEEPDFINKLNHIIDERIKFSYQQNILTNNNNSALNAINNVNMANGHDESWQKEKEQLLNEIGQLNQENNDLKINQQNLMNNNKTLENVKNNLEQRYDDLRSKNIGLEEKNKSLEERIDEYKNKLESSKYEVQKLYAELEKLKNDLRISENEKLELENSKQNMEYDLQLVSQVYTPYKCLMELPIDMKKHFLKVMKEESCIAFVTIALIWKDIQNIWICEKEYILNETFDKREIEKLNIVFKFLIEIYGSVMRQNIKKMPVKIGDMYDPEKHIKTSLGKISNGVSDVLLDGYMMESVSKVIMKAIVQVGGN